MNVETTFREEQRGGHRYRYVPLSDAPAITNGLDWDDFRYIGDNNENGVTIAVFRSVLKVDEKVVPAGRDEPIRNL